MPLQRDKLEPNRYQYLSEADSFLYYRALNGFLAHKEAIEIILSLLEAKAAQTQAAHKACTR